MANVLTDGVSSLVGGISSAISGAASYVTGGETPLPRSEVVVTNTAQFPNPAKPPVREFIGPPAPQWLPGEFDRRAAAANAQQPGTGTDYGAIFSSIIGGAGQVYGTIQQQKLKQSRQRTARAMQRGSYFGDSSSSANTVALVSIAVIGVGVLAYAATRKKGRR